jgi:hypothetical protein
VTGSSRGVKSSKGEKSEAFVPAGGPSSITMALSGIPELTKDRPTTSLQPAQTLEGNRIIVQEWQRSMYFALSTPYNQSALRYCCYAPAERSLEVGRVPQQHRVHSWPCRFGLGHESHDTLPSMTLRKPLSSFHEAVLRHAQVAFGVEAIGMAYPPLSLSTPKRCRIASADATLARVLYTFAYWHDG